MAVVANEGLEGSPSAFDRLDELRPSGSSKVGKEKPHREETAEKSENPERRGITSVAVLLGLHDHDIADEEGGHEEGIAEWVMGEFGATPR